jgi:hypothetical protein
MLEDLTENSQITKIGMGGYELKNGLAMNEIGIYFNRMNLQHQ